MIVGIGVDIVQIDRFLPWTENKALVQRFFSQQELESLEKRADLAQALAVRFAAKEAFGKALGTGLRNLVLKDIQSHLQLKVKEKRLDSLKDSQKLQ